MSKPLLALICLLLAVSAQAQTPVISSTLSVSLTGDNNSNGQANPTDQLSYSLVISNSGSGSATGVNLTMPAPPNTTLVGGSLKTSALARPDAYSVSLSGPLTASSVLTNDFGLPTKTVLSFGPSTSPASVVANGSNTAPSDQGGTVVMNTDGTFSYTPSGSFVGYDKFGYTATTTTPPNDAATVTIGVGTPVSALPNAYTITGNVTNTQSNTATALLGNDTGDQRVVSAVNGSTANVGIGVTTAQSGTVTVSANGTFVYEPLAGYTGPDSFTYSANNGFNAPSTAVVSLTIVDMVWFVNSGAGSNGTGTLARPFNNLASFAAINNGSGNNPAAGDNIFLYSGSYPASLTLLTGQKLIGAGATAPLATMAGITPAPGSASLPATGGAAPQLSSAGANVVTLGSNNLLRGLAIGTSTLVSIKGLNFGTLTVSETSINNTLSALSLQNGTVSGSFSSVTSAGGAYNIEFATVGGALAINAGAFSGATTVGVNISAGTLSLTYAGSITQTTSAPMVSVSGHSGGTLTFQTGTLTGTNTLGLSFNNADGSYNFNGPVILTGGNLSVDIVNGSDGTFSFLNTSITNPSGVGFHVEGGNGPISHTGTMSKTLSGRLIFIQGRSGGLVTLNSSFSATGSSTGLSVSACSGGTVVFGGASKVLNTGTNGAVTLVTNTGSTINFTNGGLDIDVSTAAGFNASGGGTITVQGSGNSITSGTGTALNVANTAIGASGLTFQSISSNGGANGIVLNTTGSNGGLVVTGTGAANTGGTIQNMTGADDAGATPAGTSVVLNNTAKVSLNYMHINDNSNYGIRGTSVTSLTIANCIINGANGTNQGTPFSDGSITLLELAGTCSINNTEVSGGFQRNIRVDNTLGTLDLTVNACNIHNTSNAQGDDGLAIEIGSSGGASTAVLHVTNNTFSAHGGDHFDLTLLESPTVSCVFNNNQGNPGSPVHPIGLGQGFRAAAGAFNGTFSYDYSNNTIYGTKQGNAITINKGSGTGFFQGRVSGNTIGQSGVTLSGASQSNGINVESRGGGTHTTLVTNNTIRQYREYGINIEGAEAGTTTFNVTCTTNTIDEPGSPGAAGLSLHGIQANWGIDPGNTSTLLLDLGGAGGLKNSVTNGGNEPAGGFDIRLRQRQATTIKLLGYGGANNDNAAVQTYVTARNTLTSVAATNTVPTGGGYQSIASVPQPTWPL